MTAYLFLYLQVLKRLEEEGDGPRILHSSKEKAEQEYRRKISRSPDSWSFNMGWAPDIIDLRYRLYHYLSELYSFFFFF